MIKALEPITINVDEFLAVNKFTVDEENAHIKLAGDDIKKLDASEFGKLVRVCPAGLYKEGEDGARRFEYAGCLECGTCRIACEDTIIETWNNPAPLMGVSYRFG